MPVIEAHALLQAQLEQAGLWNGWIKEHRFHDKRRYRFDFALPSQKLAVEINGGTWATSRHTTGSGYRRDREKVNLAILLGWRVLEFTTEHITRDEYALNTIREAMRDVN